MGTPDQRPAIAPRAPSRHRDTAIPSSDHKTFLSRLVLPVSSDNLGHPPSREVCEAIERSNAGILGFLLQGVDLDAMPRPADERLAEALAPLRIKLDIIIDMLGRLSYRDTELPPACDVELGPSRIAWLSPRPLQPRDWLRIELYFHPTFRQPVVVFGTVANCAEQGRDDSFRISADLIEMSEGTGESLARLAFLTQRHQRAQHPAPTAARREP